MRKQVTKKLFDTNYEKKENQIFQPVWLGGGQRGKDGQQEKNCLFPNKNGEKGRKKIRICKMTKKNV